MVVNYNLFFHIHTWHCVKVVMIVTIIFVTTGEVASKTSLRLTRKKNIFMAGFPVRSLSEWQRTLVEAGFQLALCTQVPPQWVGKPNWLCSRNLFAASLLYSNKRDCMDSNGTSIYYRSGEKALLLGRSVVKLITPGTLIEPLDNEANYLLCLSTGPGSTVGLAWIDISTGEFQVWKGSNFEWNNLSIMFWHDIII